MPKTKAKTIVMHFHSAGVVTNEELRVVYETEWTIVLDAGEWHYIFSKETGRCWNEERSTGYRTIDPIKIIL